MNALLAPRPPRLPRLRTPAGFAFVALFFYLIDGFIVHSALFAARADVLSAAVSFDLTLGVTFAYWLMMVRPGHATARSTLAVFGLSVFAAALTLPAGHRDLLQYVRYLGIPFELAVIGAVVVGVRQTNRRLAAAGTQLDVPERMRAALGGASVHARVADIVTMELAIFFYALASWRRKPFVPTGARGFTYHKRNGQAALLYTLVFLTLVEMTALDLVVRVHHHTAANVLLAIDLFGVVWLLGFARAVQLRPIVVDGDMLRLRMGLQWSVDLARSQIASVQYGRMHAPPKKTPGYVRFGLQPNVLLTLREPTIVRGPYGVGRMSERIGLSVDDVKEFEQLIGH